MPVQAGDKLKEVTLNLYASDVPEMEKTYGYGWSEKVRDLVHAHLDRRETVEDLMRKRGHRG